jgi:tetratricopeptide (TPR) repeat protein
MLRSSAIRRSLCRLLLFVLMPVAVVAASSPALLAQPAQNAQIHGRVLDASGHQVAGATVHLEQQGHSSETTTGPDGAFIFSGLAPGTYQLSAKKSGQTSKPLAAVASPEGATKSVDMVLGAQSTAQAMQFSDQPNFTVAGVTDWTAAGGHGSDVNLRTSEDLARGAVVLKPSPSDRSNSGPASESESQLRAALARDPAGFEANHALGELYLREGRYSEAVPLLEAAVRIDPAKPGSQYDLALACQGIGDPAKARDHARSALALQDSADVHRLLGDLDEALGDPLAAVSEDEKAVRLDPSERNYFQWGSELLQHRAIEPAVEVFRKGAKAHPNSERMLAALGAALFASGQDDEAAQRLCAASDLNPADPAPYIFLGKMQVAAPSPLPCVESRLARFAQQQPENAFANYYYAMVLWKADKSPENPANPQRLEALLEKAVSIDPGYDEAYLQLGILTAAQGDFAKAAGLYEKAIAIDPKQPAAHYRLGIAYARIGDHAKSKQEFATYNELKQQQAEAIERQRKEIKQFLVVLKTQPVAASAN